MVEVAKAQVACPSPPWFMGKHHEFQHSPWIHPNSIHLIFICAPIKIGIIALFIPFQINRFKIQVLMECSQLMALILQSYPALNNKMVMKNNSDFKFKIISTLRKSDVLISSPGMNFCSICRGKSACGTFPKKLSLLFLGFPILITALYS